MDSTIVDQLLDGLLSTDHPWILFVGGSMGAGKSTVIQQLFKDQHNILLLDPDRIKKMLPQWQTLWDADPLTAGSKVHTQSTEILEQTEKIALDRNFNIIVDSSMRDHVFFKRLIEDIHNTWSHYRIGFMYVNTDPTVSLTRAQSRTDRHIPVSIIEDSILCSPLCYRSLSGANFEWLKIFKVNNTDKLYFEIGSADQLSQFIHLSEPS